MGRSIVSYSVFSVFIIALQVLFLKNFILFNYIFCFVYIYIILFAPSDVKPISLMVVSFLIGVVIDFFYDTSGIHAFACVFTAFFKPFAERIALAKDMRSIHISQVGIKNFSTYAFPLLLVHIGLLLFIEAGSTSLIWITSYKVILSTALTFIIITAVQFLVSPSRNAV